MGQNHVKRNPRVLQSQIKRTMKIIKELGFEHLPTLNEFRKKVDERKWKAQSVAHLTSLENHHNALASFADAINIYGDLIDQPLTLSQFIPCDKEGKPIESPEKDNIFIMNSTAKEYGVRFLEYQQALDAVIFEMWSYKNGNKTHYLDVCRDHKTIESFINNGGKLKLKP